MLLPDYDHSILSIVASILVHYGASSDYPTLPELDMQLATQPAHVVLLILDGLGKSVLERNLPADAFLRRKIASTVTSVYPSTTVAAVTSFYSGLSPQEHGWLGWYLYMKEYATDVKAFMRSSYFTEQVLPGPHPAFSLMPYEPILARLRRAKPGIITHSVEPPYDNSGHGADACWRVTELNQFCTKLQSICTDPAQSFTLAYWPEPDAVMHEYGTDSPEARATYAELNRALEALRFTLPDTLLVITSDHGLFNCRECIDVRLDEGLAETLVMPPMLGSRATAFYVKAHRRTDFERRFKERIGDSFLLLSREQVYEAAIFGRGIPHRKFDDYIGDYIACAIADSLLAWSLPSREIVRTKANHAGLTEDEMNVAVVMDRTE